MSDITFFIDFLHKNGIPPADSREIIADDRVRRYTVQGDRPRSRNAGYRLGYLDNALIGWVKHHRTNVKLNFVKGREGKTLSKAEQAKITRELKQKREETRTAIETEQRRVAAIAGDIYASGMTLFGPHPYTAMKKISWKGLRRAGKTMHPDLKTNKGFPWVINANDLLIPVYGASGVLWNIQQIDGAGNKRFLPGGKIKGCYHPIGTFRAIYDDPLVICEGYATGRTLHEALGLPVACVLQANNQPPAAMLLRKKYPNKKFIFAADHDRTSKRPNGQPFNAGVHYALAAAVLVGGVLQTLPAEISNHPRLPTDFNDMADIAGLDAVRACFKKVLA